MKKAITLFTLLFLAIGWASAQDVYFSGNSNGIGKIWKNNTLIYSLSDTVNVSLATMQVTPDGTIYAAGRANDSSFSYVRGRVWRNDSLVFEADDNTAINALALQDSTWTAGGIGENAWENISGFVWQNGEMLYTYSDSTLSNQIQTVAIDPVTGDIYSGGTSSEFEAQAALWKNDTLLWRENSISAINALVFDSIDIYAAGSRYDEGNHAVLWKNDSIIFSIDADDAEFSTLAYYNGSVYIGGYNGNSLYIWQDDEVLYDHACTDYSNIYALIVNEFGVYYAGQIDGVATVWKDGEILYQPEDCDAVNGLAVLPSLQPSFTLTVEADSTGWGTVTGGGIYYYGDTVTIEAFPNPGCEFLFWNDSINDNPRTIIITQDSTFIALFGRIQYTINVVSDHPEWGSVTGGGTYYYNDTISIEAIANTGYEFLGWTDSIAENPREVIVTEDQTYTAQFGVQQFTVSTAVLPEGAGIVNGGGTYDYGTTITLEAIPNTGYVFKQWEDDETTNPRTVLVESDTTYTALFEALEYEITTIAQPAEGGTVIGGGVYPYGTEVTLTARPNDNYEFVCWSDGIVSNPRYITVTQDASYTALFSSQGPQNYTITVLANEPELGTVEGSGTYPEGSVITISATPFENAFFASWDDGNTDNPRNIVVTQDMTITALFKVSEITYTIEVNSSSALQGRVYGGGTYPANQTVTIGATPNVGFEFTNWQDGNTDNPRDIVVTGDAVYTAYFTIIPASTYTVTVHCDEAQGFILGQGTYNAGSTATIAAIPADGYVFVKWSDESTDNPKTILVDHDIDLSAFFNYTDVLENGLSPVTFYPNPAYDKIRIEGLEGENDLQIYNTFGLLVKTLRTNGDNEISLSGLTSGLYLIRIDGKHTLKFVKD